MRTSTKQMELKHYNIHIIITFLDWTNINFIHLCAVKCVTISVTLCKIFSTLSHLKNNQIANLIES